MVRNSRKSLVGSSQASMQYSPTYNSNEFSIARPGQQQQGGNQQQGGQRGQQQVQLQPTPQQKIYLFFSARFCEHSKRCLDRMKKNGLISQVTLCDIDTPNIQIPPFVQSVPTLYLSGEKRLLTDSSLFEWLETNNQTRAAGGAGVISMADVTGDANIFAFHQNEMIGGGSSGYAFIDESQNEQMSFGREFIDGSNKDQVNIAVFTRADGAAGGASSGPEKDQRQSDMDKAFQKMIDERNRDVSNTITGQRR
jgi:hypothetical protein